MHTRTCTFSTTSKTRQEGLGDGLYMRVACHVIYMQPQSGRVKTRTADDGCQHHILCRCCGNSVSDSRERRRLRQRSEAQGLTVACGKKQQEHFYRLQMHSVPSLAIGPVTGRDSRGYWSGSRGLREIYGNRPLRRRPRSCIQA